MRFAASAGLRQPLSPAQPADFRQLASDLEIETMDLAAEPLHNADTAIWRRVVALA